MMRGSTRTCGTMRLMLQAPHDLSPSETQQLRSHLLTCSACAMYRDGLSDIDASIQQVLAREVAGVSVRPYVRARLSRSDSRPRGSHRLHLPTLLWAPAALAMVVLVLASLLPQNHGTHSGPTRALAAGWTPIRTWISFPLTVDPNDSNHLLVGALGHVYESRDTGNHWHPLGSLGPSYVIMDLAIDARDPRHYLVATKRSILTSTDAGAHWGVAVSGLLGVQNMFLMQDPGAPSTFYVGPSALWKSTDAGANWHLAGATSMFAPNGIQALAFGPGGSLYTAVWGNGVGISTDGGLSWRRIDRGLAPNVMTVSVRPNRLLAATDLGIYRSSNDGRTWHRSGPGFPFFTTSVFDAGTYQLAGGNGGIFRSTDGGLHWTVATDGLPMYSYVHGFVGDPHHVNRVYASLDGDGNFRSDDGGLHWRPINTGLPVAGQTEGALNMSSPLVLFTRAGTLWRTDTSGTDPGTLTVDATVRQAAVSPDFAGVAYVTTTPGGWKLRALGAGGSAATTLVTASGPLPRDIAWSPDSSRVAVVRGTTVDVGSLGGGEVSWSRGPDERFLGWNRDGSGMLFWSARTHQVTVRAWSSGATMGAPLTSAARQPVVSPDRRRSAEIVDGIVTVGAWNGLKRRVAVLPATCRLLAWSDTGKSLLARCGRRASIVGLDGKVSTLRRTTQQIEWAPDAPDTILFTCRGSLWRWTPGSRPVEIVANATIPTRS